MTRYSALAELNARCVTVYPTGVKAVSFSLPSRSWASFANTTLYRGREYGWLFISARVYQKNPIYKFLAGIIPLPQQPYQLFHWIPAAGEPGRSLPSGKRYQYLGVECRWRRVVQLLQRRFGWR